MKVAASVIARECATLLGEVRDVLGFLWFVGGELLVPSAAKRVPEHPQHTHPTLQAESLERHPVL